jgi:hypothetical protein
VPLLSEARAALLPVLLHEAESDLQQAVTSTAALLTQAAAQVRAQQVQQQQGKPEQQQQQGGKKKKGGAAAVVRRLRSGSESSSSSSSCDYTPLLELPELNGWLAAVLDLLQQQESQGLLDAAAVSTAGHAVYSLMGQLVGQQLPC